MARLWRGVFLRDGVVSTDLAECRPGAVGRLVPVEETSGPGFALNRRW